MILLRDVEFLESESWYGLTDETSSTSSKVPIMDEEDADEQQEEGANFQGNFGQDRVGKNKGNQPQSLPSSRHDQAKVVPSSSRHDRVLVPSYNED